MNLIKSAIELCEKKINDRIEKGLITQEKINAAAKSLDMGIEEYCLFQEKKSLAFANGKYSLDEANTIYGYLGNSPETFNNQSFSVKFVLTEVFASLLKAK